MEKMDSEKATCQHAFVWGTLRVGTPQPGICTMCGEETSSPVVMRSDVSAYNAAMVSKKSGAFEGGAR